MFRAITRKRDPQTVDNMSDLELLTVLLGEKAAQAVMLKLEPHGGLNAYWKLGEAGPHGLLMPGIDEGLAVRLLVLWEASARISEPFRTQH